MAVKSNLANKVFIAIIPETNLELGPERVECSGREDVKSSEFTILGYVDQDSNDSSHCVHVIMISPMDWIRLARVVVMELQVLSELFVGVLLER